MTRSSTTWLTRRRSANKSSQLHHWPVDSPRSAVGSVTERRNLPGTRRPAHLGSRRPCESRSGESRRLDDHLESSVSGLAQEPVPATGHDCMFHSPPGPGRGRPGGQHSRAGRKPVMHGREAQRPVSAHRRCKVADGSHRDSVPVGKPMSGTEVRRTWSWSETSRTDQDAGPRPEAGTQKPYARLPRSAAQRKLLPQRPRGPAIIVARCRVIRVNASLARERHQTNVVGEIVFLGQVTTAVGTVASRVEGPRRLQHGHGQCQTTGIVSNGQYVTRDP
jgi:hypothetical protein